MAYLWKESPKNDNSIFTKNRILAEQWENISKAKVSSAENGDFKEAASLTFSDCWTRLTEPLFMYHSEMWLVGSIDIKFSTSVEKLFCENEPLYLFQPVWTECYSQLGMFGRGDFLLDIIKCGIYNFTQKISNDTNIVA